MSNETNVNPALPIFHIREEYWKIRSCMERRITAQYGYEPIRWFIPATFDAMGRTETHPIMCYCLDGDKRCAMFFLEPNIVGEREVNMREVFDEIALANDAFTKFFAQQDYEGPFTVNSIGFKYFGNGRAIMRTRINIDGGE